MPDRIEREPEGITYDRYRVGLLHRDLITRLGLRIAVEVDATGAKAAPYLYSLTLAQAGIPVLLVMRPLRHAEEGSEDPVWIEGWREAGLSSMARGMVASPTDLPLEDKSHDLAWNFVTLSREPEFKASLREMARVARKCVMTVHVNGRNIGHPWHRFLHKAFDLPWTHGSTDFMFPEAVLEAYREAGIDDPQMGYLDMPPWPDPPGPRDVRMHRAAIAEMGESDAQSVAWRAPIVDIVAGKQPSLLIRSLSFVEDLPVPIAIRTRFSHLFYVWGAPRS